MDECDDVSVTDADQAADGDSDAVTVMEGEGIWVCEDDPQSPATNFPNITTIILAVIQNGDLHLN